MGARTPGFQWFVAWRYLMARPRRLSGIIVVFAAVFAWVVLTAGLAAAVVPLTDSFIAAGMPITMSVVGVAAELALVVVLLYYAALRDLLLSGSRPRRGAWLTTGAALAGALVLTALAASRAMGADRLPPEARLAGLAWIAVPVAYLCWRPQALSLRRVIAITVLGGLAAGRLALAMQQPTGELVDVLVGEGERPIWLDPCVLAPAVLAVLAGAASLLLRRPSLRTVAWLGAALAIVGLSAAVWWRLTEYSFTEVFRPAAGIDYRQPVFVIIPAAIGGVLLLWSLLLLGIRYVFTFFTTVSIGGVAIGTMALVITLSVMGGFENDLREKILGSNAHVLVSREDEKSFAEYHTVMEGIARTRGVIGMSPYLETEVVVAGSSNYFNVVVRGIDPRTIARVTDLQDDLEDREALQRMYPMEDDGGLGEPPPDAAAAVEEPDDGGAGDGGGDAVDPAPDDMNVGDVEPDDWSGGGAEAGDPEPPAGDAPPAGVVDPAPDDMVVGEAQVDDWSGESGDALIEAIEGVEITSDGVIPPAERTLAPEVAALPGVLVGRELVKQINLYVGQEVKIISPLGQNTIAGQTAYLKPYRVAGIFFTGMYEYDLKRVYVELGTLQDFLDVPDVASGIEIRVADPEDTDAVVAALRRNIGGGYRIQDWKELNRSLFSALKLEKIAMFLVLAIIILVASFSIVGNLIMVVVEKAREIAVLKTLGASDGGVTRIFIVQGFLIGLVGTLIGVSLGLGVCWVGDRFGIGIPPDVYYIDRLPIHVDLWSVAQVAAAGVLISVAATIYPAQIAARLRPVQGLRYE